MTNEYGKPAKGRIIFCGAMVHCTIVNTAADWDMPQYAITKTPSWQELNKGKKSKRQRRA